MIITVSILYRDRKNYAFCGAFLGRGIRYKKYFFYAEEASYIKKTFLR